MTIMRLIAIKFFNRLTALIYIYACVDVCVCVCVCVYIYIYIYIYIRGVNFNALTHVINLKNLTR